MPGLILRMHGMNLGLCILRRLEVTFSLGSAYMHVHIQIRFIYFARVRFFRTSLPSFVKYLHYHWIKHTHTHTKKKKLLVNH